MDLALKDHLKVAEQVLTSKVGDETVLLNLQTGMYYCLDPVGTRFLEVLQQNGRLDEAHHALLEQYDVSAAKLEADLLKLSQEMLTRGLLMKVNEAAA